MLFSIIFDCFSSSSFLFAKSSFWFLSFSFFLCSSLFFSCSEFAVRFLLFPTSLFSEIILLYAGISLFTILMRLIFLEDLFAISFTLLKRAFICSLESFNSESLRAFSISSFSGAEIFIFGAAETTLSIVSLISIFFWSFSFSLDWWSFTLSFSAPILFS